jgi:hypothetical protein
MTINQLFKKKPSKEFIKDILILYGLENFEDNKQFTRKDLKNLNLCDNISKISHKFKDYYLPCKYKIYLQNISIKKSITLLRQLLKLYDYNVKSNEKYIKGEKIIVYQILPKNSQKKKITSNNKCVISFD